MSETLRYLRHIETGEVRSFGPADDEAMQRLVVEMVDGQPAWAVSGPPETSEED